MRPNYVIPVKHFLDSFKSVVAAGHRQEEIRNWCQENIGKPYPIIEYPQDGVPIGPDYNDEEGRWVCFGHANGYDVGYDSVDLVDNWCFRDQKDASWFALRWL